ncbi:MAG TPA: hypothetical protein VMS64_30595 [Candidatus Methylomirabilis sp.]|nr:hypothetical protein [Candidatus Methylomirabilis sp.]
MFTAAAMFRWPKYQAYFDGTAKPAAARSGAQSQRKRATEK